MPFNISLTLFKKLLTRVFDVFRHVCMPSGEIQRERFQNMFDSNTLSPMKKTMILIAAFAIAVVAVGQELTASIKNPEPVKRAAVFSWATTTFDFGKIVKGEPVTHEFTFTNAGSDALIISSVQASCGCTVTAYSKDPIPAGEKGFVKATYNAANAGVFSKTVTINANTEDAVVLLTIKGEVLEKTDQ